jgi:hypothetical protein
MAIVKQSSGHKPQWFDKLPRLVCIAAVLTLTAAAVSGLLGWRLDTLVAAQQVAKNAEKHSQDKNLTAAIEAAKSQWAQKKDGFEKALNSAKLKIKAEQSTSANIRKQLVALQKEMAALKKSGNDKSAETVATAEQTPVTAPANPIETAPAAEPSSSADAADSESAPNQNASNQSAPQTTPSAVATTATTTASPAPTTGQKQPQSALLAVPDADAVASE